MQTGVWLLPWWQWLSLFGQCFASSSVAG